MPRFIGGVIDVDGEASDGTQDENTSVTGLTDGRFVVSWTQREQVSGGNGFRTYYRVFAADGAPVTGERKIDSQYAPDATANSIVGDSTVTALPGGGFAIGFLDTTGFFGSPRVSGFKYWTATVTGPSYTETRSSLPQGNAQQGSVATLATGSAISVVSESNGGPAGYALVVGGQTLFSTAAFMGFPPGIAAFGDGYVVIYSQRSAAPAGDDVFGIIKATGFSDAPFLVHAAAAGGQTTASFMRPVVALKDGGFVVTWNNGVAAGGGTSLVRVYGSDGQPRTGEIVLNASPGDGDFNPEVAPLDDGSFVVVFGSQLRHFLADGTAVGGFFTLPANTAGNSNPQNSYSVSSLGGSRVVFSFADSEARAQIIDVVNIVPGTEAGETLVGTDTYDELNGLGGNDTLLGYRGFDRLFGGDGDDLILPASGGGEVDGGAGIDTLSFVDIEGRVEVTLATAASAGTALIVGGDSVTVAGIENVTGTTFIGTGAPGSGDLIIGNEAANLLRGLDGADVMGGGFGADTLEGGPGTDILYGNQDDDVLYGNQDADQLYGGQGNDTVYGGQGDDLVFGNLGDDALYGNLGNDTLSGGAGMNRLDGGDGVDTVSYADAGSGVNLSLLLQGSNQATGPSIDNLVGIENLTGSAFADFLAGDAGVNVLSGGAGADLIYGGFGADVIFGNQDADVLYGNQDADLIYGGQGNDVIYGGQGDDLVFGNAGADILYGNLGTDVFAYVTPGDSASGGVDLIADFLPGTDKIDLRFVRRGPADTYALIYSNGLTAVTVDLDGDGGQDMNIVAVGTLTAADIVFG